MELPLTIPEIHKLLPHRYPMLLVDRIVEFYDGERIVGIKAVTANEPFFNGHFPGLPIMPGVLMVEALAQLGVLYSKMCSDSPDPDCLIVFAGVDGVRFRRQVVPGDLLTIEMKFIKKRGPIWKMDGTARVGDEVAVEGLFTSAVSEQPA